MRRSRAEIAFALGVFFAGLFVLVLAGDPHKSYAPGPGSKFTPDIGSPCTFRIRTKPESVSLPLLVACINKERSNPRMPSPSPVLAALQAVVQTVEFERDAAARLAGVASKPPDDLHRSRAYRLWRWQRELSDTDSLPPIGVPDLDDLVALCGTSRGCSSVNESMNRLAAEMESDLVNLREMLARYRALKFPREAGFDNAFRERFDRLSRFTVTRLFREAEPQAAPGIPGDSRARSPLNDKSDRRSPSVDFPATALILRQIALDVEPPKSGTERYAPWCTGTLIANQPEVVSSVVLTAAHCVCGIEDGTSRPAAAARSEACLGFQERARKGETPHRVLDGKHYRVFFQGVGVRKVARFEVNPSYVSYRKIRVGVSEVELTGADLALIFLDEPVAAIKPAVARKGDGAVLKDDVAVAVGFGQHRRLDSATSTTELMGAGAKVHLLTSVEVYQGTLLTWASPPNAPPTDPGMFGNICPGDSGGPLFFTEWSEAPTLHNDYALLGVASFAWARVCRPDNTAVTFWTDLRRHGPWLAQFVPNAPQNWSSRLDPIINPDTQFVVQKPDGVLYRRGAAQLSVPFLIPKAQDGSTITITANATCTAAGPKPSFCAATSIKLGVRGPAGAGDGCTKLVQDVVAECTLTAVSGNWTVTVEGYLNPIAGLALTEAQDVQLVGRFVAPPRHYTLPAYPDVDPREAEVEIDEVGSP